jgi:hypothetical protein
VVGSLLRRILRIPVGVAGLLHQHPWPIVSSRALTYVGLCLIVAVLAVLWAVPPEAATIAAFLESRLLAIAISGVIVLIFLIWRLPQWQAASTRQQLKQEDYLDLENKLRTTLLQAAGGILVLVGVFFSVRQIVDTEQNLRATQEQTRQGQIADRFNRAIDQLGAVDPNGKRRIEVRLGGIYGLEQIANVSDDDYGQVIEILTAYVRQNAPWPPESQPTPTAPLTPIVSAPVTPVAYVTPGADIQAVLTVLGRRRHQYGSGEQQRLDLHQTDLRGADVRRAHLEGAMLYDAHWRELTSSSHTWRKPSSSARIWRELTSTARTWRMPTSPTQTCGREPISKTRT